MSQSVNSARLFIYFYFCISLEIEILRTEKEKKNEDDRKRWYHADASRRSLWGRPLEALVISNYAGTRPEVSGVKEEGGKQDRKHEGTPDLR